MDSNRIWIVGGTLVVVVVLALGGLLGVKPQLDAAAVSNSDRESVELMNRTHTAELARLKEQAANIDQLAAQVAELRRSVPTSADLDTFIGELALLQAANKVSVASFVPSDAALFVPAPEIKAVVPATVLDNNFVTISIAITVTGAREATLNFLSGLQAGSRLVLVSDVNVAAADEAGVTTTTITGLIYVLLDAPYVDPTAVVAPATPEATAAE